MGCKFQKSALARSSETLALAESGGSKCKENRQGLGAGRRRSRPHGPGYCPCRRVGQSP